MFFKKNRHSDVNSESKDVDLFDDDLDEFDIDTNLNIEDEDEFDIDTNLNIENEDEFDIDPRSTYAIILQMFFDDYTNLSSAASRLSAMLELGIFDSESIKIIEDTEWYAEHTLKMYNDSKEYRKSNLELLDAECKNIDYRIRKSLELKILALNKLKTGIKNNDQSLGQEGLDEIEKSVSIISPVLEDIKNIIVETLY